MNSTESPPSAPPQNDSADFTADRVGGDELRVSLARIITAWGFGAVYVNTIGGAIYTAWVRQLSTNDVLFGTLAAALPFMSVLQVVAARLIEKHRKRKRQMIVNQLIGRTLWLVAALAPLAWIYFPERFSKVQIVNLVFLCIATSGVFQALSGPAFFSWMSDLVPERVRPTFFARRLQVGTLAAVGASVIGGLIADNFPHLPVYCVVLALAAVAGIVDIACFFRVAEPPMMPRTDDEGNVVETPPFWESVREPLRDPAVRHFLLFVSLLMAGYGLQGPFLWLHSLENLGLSKTITGVIVNIAPLLGMAWSLTFWRSAIRSYGTRPVMRLNALGLVFIPLAWLFAGRGEWISIAVITFLSGCMAGALELSNQTVLSGIAPNFPRPTLVALFSIAAGVSFAVASILGGVLAQFMRGYEWEIGGFSILNFHVLFLCSMLVRVINAFVVAPRLYEPTSTPTIEAFKDILPELAQSLADLLTRPLAKSGK
ncbi:MAG TPA: MFS transporter [Abditibacteriaceae bacterium]|jgi:MFS family permease